MENLPTLKKKRSAAKGWVTRARKALATVLAEEPRNRTKLLDAIAEFDKHLGGFDEAQAEVELVLDEADLDADVEESADFREHARVVRVEASCILFDMDKEEQKVEQKSVSSASSVRPDVKLPSLTLPTFGGNVLDWQPFWDQYDAVVHSTDLPEVTKFTYLRSLLEGEASEVIQGLSLTAAHYATACKILKERFGRKERIIFGHVQELLSLATVNQYSLSSLRKLQNSLLAHTRSLEALGIDGSQYGVLLTPIVLAALPSEIRMLWARQSENKESDLTFLLEFLDQELKTRETSQTFKKEVKPDQKKSKVTQVKKIPEVKKASATSLSSSASSSPVCAFCEKTGHVIEQCYSFKRLTVSQRIEKVKALRLCWKCFGKHRSIFCKKKIVPCEKCNSYRHNFLVCNGDQKDKGNQKTLSNDKEDPVKPEATHSTTGSSMTKKSTSDVVMQVLRLEVRGRNGIVQANVLFDSGSDRTYVSSDLVHQVDPEFQKTERVAVCSFGSGKASKEELRNIYNVELRGSQSGCGVISATEVPVVCAPIFRQKVPADILKEFGNLKLVEDYSQSNMVNIDILIGLDHYWKFITPEIVSLPDSNLGLVAQRTIFGWILSGSYGDSTCAVSHQLFCVSDTNIKQLWEVELEPDSLPDSAILQKFNDSIDFKDGRYSVSLPWKTKEHADSLQNNFDSAKKRLQSLSRKLEKQPKLKEQYNAALQEMVDTGVAEEVPEEDIPSRNPVFYMPHRPVVKESSVSTKVRPVFDASAKGSNGLSLNECMETGPNLLPNLVEILVRFRRRPVALVADIQKAFLQIEVKPEDRDVHRFLWEKDGIIHIMRLARVPFGNRSSPFILNAVIKHHLQKFESSPVVEELNQDLYVDDWLSGADDDGEASLKVEEASAIMSQCSMNLTKWGSNKKTVLDQALRNLSGKSEHLSNLKVLGLRWNPEDDCFLFDGLALEKGLVITKRVVLSLIARLYDPLGFLTPFVIKLKCLFQDLWRLGIEWDTEVPEEFSRQAVSWVEDLSRLKDRFRILRPFSLGAWDDIVSVQIHSFGDASERAYGASVYLVACLGNGTVTSALVLSKTKVAPVKKITLPRLELLGAVLAAQLLDFVCRALKLDKDGSICWSDSTVVLSWIQGDSSRWKPFVANRIGMIQQLTNPSQWKHCAGTDNPADLLTRGVSANDLIESTLWRNGPEFLTENVNSWESIDIPVEVAFDACQEEAKKSVTCFSSAEVRVFDVSRWGTLVRAIRVVSWVLRVITRGSSKGELTFEELEKAKFVLIRETQYQAFLQEIEDLKKGTPVSKRSKIYKLSPYLDDDGLLRIKGRLDYSDMSFESKHPIIVPTGHLATLLVRHQHQLLKHAGVGAMLTSLRNQYWILGARRLAKRVKRFCVSCQKVDARSVEQPLAPLHESRVKQARPFAVTGIDHAGPLFCADFPRKKFYILLLTCAVSRAVHLELVNSLNVEDCLLAIRRFVARRGLPAVFWSDNAKTFVAVRHQLLTTFSANRLRWNFIPPRSPWWGGWWERLVRSVKGALKKSVGKRCLVRAELETVLHEVEGCVNSRPLTFLSDEACEASPLTPSHFLIGKSNIYEPDEPIQPVSGTHEDLVQRKLLKDELLDRFWNLWSNEYIRGLPGWRGSDKESQIQKNSLVLIREDGWPRMTWPLGVVIEVYPGRDGVIRSCKVKTQRGEFVRAVQRLHVLEVDTVLPFAVVIDSVPAEEQTTETVVESIVPVESEKLSRYGRKVKSVERLDL